jgi:hypothetical protein
MRAAVAGLNRMGRSDPLTMLPGRHTVDAELDTQAFDELAADISGADADIHRCGE